MSFLKWLSLGALLLLLVSFQNCSNSFHTAKTNHTTISKNNSGNGNAYDGKILVQTPEYMSPGETVSVYVKGGKAPYTLSSNISGATFVMQSEGIYQFTIPSTEVGQIATVNVFDAEGGTGLAQIRIWGINKWFFLNTKGITSDSFGNLYVVEQDFPALTILDSNGDELQKITNYSIPGLNFSLPNRVALSPSGIIYVTNSDLSSKDYIVGLDPTRVTKEIQIDDANNNLWNACGGLTDLKVATNGTIYASCDSAIFLLNESGELLSSFSLSEDPLKPIGGITLKEDGQIIVARWAGIFETYSQNGNLLSSVTLQGKDYTDELIPVDIELVNPTEVAVIFAGNTHDYTVTVDIATGNILKFALSSGSNIYLGSTVDSTILPDGQLVMTTDMSNITLHDGVDYIRTSFYGPISEDLRGFYFPESIFIDEQERITVIDNRNFRITQFNKDGQILKSNYGNDSQNWWLKHSHDVHVSINGDIFASDPGNNRIEVVEANGGYRSFSAPGASGLALSNDGQRVYVTNQWNSGVKAFSSRGKFLFDFESPTGAETRNASDVVIIEGEAFVLSSLRGLISVFDLDGNFKRSLGRLTEEHSAGTANNPSKMAYDSQRKALYVTDSGNHRILIFNTDGTFIGQFGHEGTGFGEFRDPKGIAVDNEGFVYVVDTLNSRIQVLPPLAPLP